MWHPTGFDHHRAEVASEGRRLEMETKAQRAARCADAFARLDPNDPLAKHVDRPPSLLRRLWRKLRG